MNCQQAKEWIDRRVHEDVPGAAVTAGESRGDTQGRGRGSAERVFDWSELDAHLDACPRCRDEFDELVRVRRLLATAGNDQPNEAEVQSMWAAVQGAAAVPVKNVAKVRTGWWARNRLMVAAGLSAAAVLGLAFQLGQARYGRSVFKGWGGSYIFSNVDTSLPTGSAGDEGNADRASASTVRGVGTSARMYATDNNERWAVPAMPAMRERVDTAKWASAVGPQEFGGKSQLGAEVLAAAAAPPAPAPAAADSAPKFIPLESLPAEEFAGMLDKIRADKAGDTRSSRSKEKRPPSEPRAEEKLLPAGEWDRVAADQAANVPRPAAPENLKIIKTGDLTLQVPVYREAVERIVRIVFDRGGFIADATTHEGNDGTTSGRIVVRVSPDRFDETFVALKAVGRVEAENVKAADVTAEFVDLEARIKSLQITEERLRELVANKSFVDKIASLLEVEQELNRVRTEIEQMQGQLRVMADRVSLSTIAVTVREPGRTVPSASLSVEVSTLDEAAKALGDLLAGSGGRLISGKTSKRSDGTLMGEYQLETTLDQFGKVVAGIEGLGRVEGRQVKDHQFKPADDAGLESVKCAIALVLFERSRQLPSATLRLEVDNLERAVGALSGILEQFQAVPVSSQSTSQNQGVAASDMRVRVPAGQFGCLLDALEPLGRTTVKAVAGEAGRIVGGAAAVPCELALTLAERPREVPQGTMGIEVPAFETARKALSKAIADVHAQVLHSSSNQRNDGTWTGTFRLNVPGKDMEAFVLSIEGLGRVTARQISGLGLGDLSRIDPNAMGAIELTLGEKSTLAPAPDQTTASLRASIRDGLAGLYTSLGMIAYGMVVLLPWLVLAGLVGVLVARLRRAQGRKKAAEAAGA